MPEIIDYEVNLTYSIKVRANHVQDALAVAREAISEEDHAPQAMVNIFARAEKPLLVDTNIRRVR